MRLPLSTTAWTNLEGEPSKVIGLNQTLVLYIYLCLSGIWARLVGKNGHQNLPCCDDIGLYAQNKDIIMSFET